MQYQRRREIRDVSAPISEVDTALRFVAYKRNVTDFQVGKISHIFSILGLRLFQITDSM